MTGRSDGSNSHQVRRRSANSAPLRAEGRSERSTAIHCVALNIVRLKDDEESLDGRMEMAAMNDDYLLELLQNAVEKLYTRRP